jgi:cytidylate kinase
MVKNKLLLTLLFALLLGPQGTHCFGDKGQNFSAKMIITIDGGSATKKSPVSRAIAKKFDLLYLETGAIYRAVTHTLMHAGIEPVIGDRRKADSFLAKAKFKCFVEDNFVQFSINGVHLDAKELRSPEINANVAKYTSTFKSIHDFCTKCALDVLNLREFTEHKGVVAEGRGCGIYLFPDADLKFWFVASDNAKVDFRLNVEKEMDNPLERDELDFNRAFCPTVKPEDAIVIWTSSRTIEENVALVSAFVEQKLDIKTHPQAK